MKRVLYVWLPDWPTQRLTAARPELKGRPLVLYETIRGVQRITVCSPEAVARGLRPGMPVAEARAACGFAGTKGNLQVEPYDPTADREALEKLVDRCERFSPTVGLESGDRPEGVLLDVTGVAGLFGGETPLAEALARDFGERGLVVRLGLADTIGAAWAAARFGGGEGGRERREEVSSSLFSLPPSLLSFAISHSLLADLAPLPIEALRLSGGILDSLRQLGIDRIARLEALPRQDLSARFTPELLRRMDQAAGRLAEAIPGRRAAPEFQVEWSAEHPVARRETIEAAVRQLIRELCEKLTRHGRGAVQVECRLLCPPHLPARVEVGMFEPSTSWGHVFGLIELRLERLRLPGPVVAILASATATAPLVYEQQELFSREELSPQPSFQGRGRSWQRRQLAGLVDRLSSRLGRQAVLGVRLLADAQPELAWRGEPLVERSKRRTTRTNRELPPRPLMLRRRPVPLAAMSIGPDGFGGSGCPARFQFDGREHRVARCWGPERIETGWWRGQVVGRDYYRVETTQGNHYWLFRRLRDGKWFLQGAFN